MSCCNNFSLTFTKTDEFTNEHLEFTIDTNSHFRLLDMQGLGELETNYTLSNSPNLDGGYISSSYVGSRYINLLFEIYCEEKRFFTKFFKNRSCGKLIINNCDFKTFIDYHTVSANFIQPTICDNPKLQLILLAPSPYFKDIDDFGQNIVERVKLWHTPMVFEKGKPIVTDYKKFNSYASVSNDGDVEIGVILRITTNNYTKKPKIILNDNKFIEVDVELRPEDVLEINTNKRNKYVKLNGQNILQKMNPDSTLFQLPVGKHKLSFSAEDGVQSLNIFVSRRYEYVSM